MKLLINKLYVPDVLGRPQICRSPVTRTHTVHQVRVPVDDNRNPVRDGTTFTPKTI